MQYPWIPKIFGTNFSEIDHEKTYRYSILYMVPPLHIYIYIYIVCIYIYTYTYTYIHRFSLVLKNQHILIESPAVDFQVQDEALVKLIWTDELLQDVGGTG